MQVGCACGREVAELGIVGALAVHDAVRELRNDEVEVHVALPVGMGGHVDRHALDARREVGAVVEVEAAQEVLVRLAVPGVLGDDQAGHHLEQLADPQQRPRRQLLAEHRALARRAGLPGQHDPVRRDHDLLEVGARQAGGFRRCPAGKCRRGDRCRRAAPKQPAIPAHDCTPRRPDIC